MGNNSSHKIKQLEDEVLVLRQKVKQASDYGQEKSSMLCVIALMVQRLGGQESVGPEDAQFLKDWAAGRIHLKVEQDGIYTRFTVLKEVGEPDPPKSGG